MEKLTIDEIVRAVHGSFGYPADTPVTGISTDTRTIGEGSVFIAIKGDRFDGHDYAAKAMELGAAAVITERPVDGARCIVVDSTRQALLDAAGYYRDKLGLTVVGVTGSVGKTTTKDMTALVAAKKFKTLKTQGNLNNEIGMPRTLLELDSSYGAAVIEMGMNHKGEISRMSMSCKPDVCLITNVGVSHIENLGSRENILRAKLEILDGARAGAPLILNKDNDMLAAAEIYGGRQVIYYSVKDTSAQVWADSIVSEGRSVSFDIHYDGGTYPARIECPGEHNVSNALAAFSVGMALGVSPEDAAAAVGEFRPEGLRQNILEREGVTVVMDCYNAAPDSMRASLETLRGLNVPGKRYCVLADMLELGEKSPEYHRSVGELVPLSGADELLCCGEMSRNYIKGALEKGFDKAAIRHFESPAEIAGYLKDRLRPGDAVLLKGSRGMKLEGVFTGLYGEIG